MFCSSSKHDVKKTSYRQSKICSSFEISLHPKFVPSERLLTGSNCSINILCVVVVHDFFNSSIFLCVNYIKGRHVLKDLSHYNELEHKIYRKLKYIIGQAKHSSRSSQWHVEISIPFSEGKDANPIQLKHDQTYQ